MLDDVVVPVDHPHLPVRPDLGRDRAGPLVGAGQQAGVVPGDEPAALRLEQELPDDVPGRLGHERRPVPVVARPRPRRVQRVPGGGRVRPVVVHLADGPGGREHAVQVRDVLQPLDRQPADRLVRPVRDVQVEARVLVGRPGEQVPLLAEPEAPSVVRQRREELDLGPVRLHPPDALGEPRRLAADGPVEPGVPDDAVDPVVRPVPQVARAGVGVVGAPAGEQHPPLVGLVVAVRVLQEQHVRGLGDDHPAVGEAQAGRDRQLVGEHGELVGDPVVVRVLKDADPVPALARLLYLVRVVERLGDPQPPALVPRHRDRLEDLRVAGEQLGLEPGRGDHVRHRLLGGDRLLDLGDQVPGRAPRLVRQVVRGLALAVLERRQLGLRLQRPVAGRPADAALQQVLKVLVPPGPLVVAPGGVEHPALAVRPGPGVRLLALLVVPGRQHLAALLVVHLVDVRLVPALDLPQAFEHRVVGLGVRLLEHAGAVPLEPPAGQLGQRLRLAEAEGPAVDHGVPAAAGDVVEDRRLDGRRPPVDVRVQQQGVEPLEVLRRDLPEVVDVRQVDPAEGHLADGLAEPLQRLVVAVVAEEQHLDPPGRADLVRRGDGGSAAAAVRARAGERQGGQEGRGKNAERGVDRSGQSHREGSFRKCRAASSVSRASRPCVRLGSRMDSADRGSFTFCPVSTGGTPVTRRGGFRCAVVRTVARGAPFVAQFG
ncbi:MAG: hypothetical protein AVDCRST_MAG64-1080 [uncultured Phycisphaerae bacterium]|uniref:Uncharacterized protein n=1 Tax=uncultured Phycisphaerae bacterium TaxID=904963 RepID=A0A6J4NMU6_9BACT|nr:MAG: hypothetical protein AVDCRST_MAG64-1080 [uncultured Phycisphaerae bacterium]